MGCNKRGEGALRVSPLCTISEDVKPPGNDLLNHESELIVVMDSRDKLRKEKKTKVRGNKR